jgi:hypothetical protein
LEHVLIPSPEARPTDRPAELALQKTLRLIVDATRSLQTEPLPVVIFLFGDWSGMRKSEADQLIDELLKTSAIAYGLKDSRSPQMGPMMKGPLRLLGEQLAIANYIATETGGQYFRVTPETYASTLEEILRQLHFRYELGFEPEALDGKRHKLGVELAKAERDQHKGVRLRCREAYVPTAQSADDTVRRKSYAY